MTPEYPNGNIDQNLPHQTETVSEPAVVVHKSFLHKWGSLIVLSMALAIIIIDTTLLNVSLRAIIDDLHTDLKSMQWVITIYSLILAAFTITGGRLGDLFGRKKMFLVGAIIFAIGSFIASISKSVETMIIGEAIIEGLGAALMMPATASLLITNYRDRDRAIAFGIWGGIAAASSAVGPILGGWLTTNYSWRWGFRINIVVVALVLLGAYLIKENHQLRIKSKIDFGGIILSSLGLLSIVFGFIQSSTFGWIKVKEPMVLFGHAINLGQLSATPVFIALGLLILAVFIWWENFREKNGLTPLVSLQIFRNRPFIAGVATVSVLALGQAGLFFTIPVFLQAVRKLDALHTGLTLLPLSLAVMISAPLSAFINKYINPKHLTQIGLGLSSIGFLIFYWTLTVDSTVWTLAPGFIIFGLGMGLIMAQVSNITLSAVTPQEAGEASGVNNTLRMVGQTLGSAILGAILLSTLVTNVTTGVNNSRIIPNQVKPQIEEQVSEHISSISFGESGEASAHMPKELVAELGKITNQAIVDSNKTVMLYGLLFVLLGLIISTQLPNTSKENEPAGIPEVTDEVVEAKELVMSKKTASILVVLGLAIIIALLMAYMNIENETKQETKESTHNTPRQEVSTERSPMIENKLEHRNTNANTEQQNQPVEVGENNTIESTPELNSTTYTNSELHFSFTKPDDWQIVKNSNGEIVFKSPNGLYNVQSSDAPNSDMDSLKDFLTSQPNLHNIKLTTFNGKPAYSFDIDASYATGFAWLDKNRLFYVLGLGSDHTPLKDIQTF